MTTRRNKLTKSLTQATAWLVLLVVGLGFTRSLVVCTQPCCAGHVKLSASCDLSGAPAEPSAAPACSCCQHLPIARGHRRGGGVTVSPTCGGCQHVALGVDLGLPPSTAPTLDSPAAVAALAIGAPAWIEAEALEVVHPPATGPPRCDQRTALLATTVLRL